MFILFDIGGTKMRIAKSDGEIILGTAIKLNTPASFDEAIELLVKTATDLAGEDKIEGVVGGLTGVVEPSDGRLTFAPHTPDWLGKPFVKAVSTALDAPVYVENDSVMVGLGEATYGAGRGAKILMYMTVSTGVGGARIVDGHIDSGAFGFEPGHQLIGSDKDAETLESLVSGSALERQFNKKPQDIPQTDPVWQKIAETLAIGIYNSALHWSPDVIVVGGSMIVGSPAIPFDTVIETLTKKNKVMNPLPNIKRAELGDEGGLYGALAYLNKVVLGQDVLE